jgi:hypothetical protein
VAAPGLVVQPEQEQPSAANGSSTPESQTEDSKNQVAVQERPTLTSVTKYIRLAAIILLIVAALSIIIALTVNLYMGLIPMSSAQPIAESATPSDGVLSQRAGLLVWTQGLGACLALVFYFEGERLRAFTHRIWRSVRDEVTHSLQE